MNTVTCRHIGKSAHQHVAEGLQKYMFPYFSFSFPSFLLLLSPHSSHSYLQVLPDSFWIVLIHADIAETAEPGNNEWPCTDKVNLVSSKRTPTHIRAAWPMSWQQLCQPSSWLLRGGRRGLLGVKWSQSHTEKQHYTPH